MADRATSAIASARAIAVATIGLAAAPSTELCAKDVEANVLIVEKSGVKPASKVMRLDLPLKYNGAYISDVTVEIGVAGHVAVDTKSLVISLSKFMTPAAISKLTRRQEITANGEATPAGETEVFKKSAGDEKSLLLVRMFERKTNDQPRAENPVEPKGGNSDLGPFIALEEWQARGLDIAYDAQSSELTFKPAVSQLRESNLSLGITSRRSESTTPQTPAYFSAYLTTRMNADYVHSASFGETGVQAPNFAFESAARIGAVVVEGEASLTARPSRSGEFAQSSGLYEFARHGTRLIYDWPDEVLRIRAGDLTSIAAGFETPVDMLGVSVERSYAQLKPGQSIQPTGAQSFRIERPSNVDVISDGITIRRLRLPPGNYNLRDLPLNSGATKIALAIEDDTGLRQTLEFNAFSSASLLAPGLDEWQIASGIRSQRSLDGGKRVAGGPVEYTDIDYLFDKPVISAFYRLGLTPGKMAGLTVEADDKTATAGASLLTNTPIGFVTVDLGVTANADIGTGWRGRALYEVGNLKLDSGLNHSFALTGEYTSARFANLAAGPSASLDAGIKLGALYSRSFTEDVTASVNISLESTPSLVDIGRWDAGLTVTDRLTDSISGALSIGYGEGVLGPAPHSTCVCDNALEGRGMHGLVRLTYRPDPASNVSLDADSLAKSARLSASRSEGSGLGAWTASVDTGYDASGKSADLNAAASITGNRADVSVSHAVRTDLFAPKGRGATALDERSSIRVETSVATADGLWSFGRPVHNSFAIIDPHETLGDRTVTAGSKDLEISKSDSFAPALVSDISPYVQKRLAYDVDNLPTGYDLGAGAFDLNGPYKSGYRLRAGSDYTVTALGTLLNQDGKPIALLQGMAREEGKAQGPARELFTNKAGRFGAQGLAPGRWILEMATDPEPTRFALTIPSGTSGLFQVGVLKPL